MKLRVFNVEGDVVSLTAQPNDSVLTVKSLMTKERNMKLLHQGNLLKNEHPLSFYNIKDGDSLVLLESRPSPPPVVTSPGETPSRALINKVTSYGKSEETPAQIPQSSVPRISLSQIFSQMNSPSFFSNFFSSNQGTASTQSTDTAEDNESEEESNDEEVEDLTLPEIEADSLAQLKDMGFSEEKAKKALLLNRMDVQLAMDWLLQHENDPDIDQPLTAQQVQRIVNEGNPPSRTNFVPNPEAVQKLKDMGFNEDDINEALRMTNNNQEAACAWLLGDREMDTDESPSNFLRALLTNPTFQSSLTNPRVVEALRTLMSNPSAVSEYVNDPEIAPILGLYSYIFSNN